jgi:hypothetical protein
VQVSSPNEADHRRQLAQGINRANRGQINATLFVTLDPGATQTPVVDSRISIQTCAILSPQTESAALATTWVVCTSGSMVIQHAASAATDRTFVMAMIG